MKAKAFVFACLLLAITVNCQQKRNFQVLVLGAGSAGLNAAATLQTAGVDYWVLEGTDRLGGRVYSSTFRGVPIEYGANWINGYNQSATSFRNPSIALQQASGLSCTTAFNIGIYGARGNPVNYSVVQDITTAFGNSFTTNNPLNYLDGMNQALTTLGYPTVDNLPDYARATVFGNMCNGGNLPQESSFARGAYATTVTNFSGQDCLVNDAEGYSKMLTRFASNAGITNKTTTSAIVDSIVYNSSGVYVYVRGDPTPYTAAKAIITFPLGVLKNKTSMFSPALPDAKRAGINAWGYGNLVKFWVKFNDAWWPNGQTTWWYNNGTGLPCSFPSYFINLNHQSLVPGSAAVLFFAIGDTAKRYTTQSKNITMDEIYNALVDIHGSTGATRPVDITWYDWSQNEFAFGSYSFGRMNATNQHLNDIKASVNNMLYFAGEHTSLNFWGYVHGALLEGEAAAREVISSLPTAAPTTAAPTPKSDAAHNIVSMLVSMLALVQFLF